MLSILYSTSDSDKREQKSNRRFLSTFYGQNECHCVRQWREAMDLKKSLNASFCTLDFTSVYKIIPHLYFGHRKKISKYVKEHQEVRLKCPAGCELSHEVQDEKIAGPEIIFPTLSKVFLMLEDHMVKLHT